MANNDPIGKTGQHFKEKALIILPARCAKNKQTPLQKKTKNLLACIQTAHLNPIQHLGDRLAADCELTNLTIAFVTEWQLIPAASFINLGL